MGYHADCRMFAWWYQEIIIVKLSIEDDADIVGCSHDDDKELL
jgi:hypothetical protein